MDPVERTITLPIDPDETWDLLTRAEDLAGWLAAAVTFEPRAGTAGTVVDHDGTVRHLVVDRVDPGRQLAWHWWTDDAPESASQVTITVAPTDGGTAVRVVEELVAGTPTVARAQAGEAWSHRLLHLEALLLIAAAVRG